MNDFWQAAQAVMVVESGVIVGVIQLEEEAPGVLSVESSAAGDSRWSHLAHALIISSTQFVEDPQLKAKLLAVAGWLVGYAIKEQGTPDKEEFPF